MTKKKSHQKKTTNNNNGKKKCPSTEGVSGVLLKSLETSRQMGRFVTQLSLSFLFAERTWTSSFPRPLRQVLSLSPSPQAAASPLRLT